MEELGGPGVHSRNGVCQLVAADEADAIDAARELLGYLPSRIGGRAPTAAAPAAAGAGATRATSSPPSRDASTTCATWSRRDLRRRSARSSSAARWARNMVTGFARIEGRPVGVVANQPRRLGGVIDAAAAEKAACFVDSCDRFGLPLVVARRHPGLHARHRGRSGPG